MSWLDPDTTVLLLAGRQTSAYFDAKLPLPATPALRGLPPVFQAVAGTPARDFRFSNPVVPVPR